jgi:hypothetical protein
MFHKVAANVPQICDGRDFHHKCLIEDINF